ncbi:MAG: DUF4388 domain-containing protein [Gemmatimonadetes bacterium]|nr:DUF4388 domain-containing protein [Gemmatimonadota bacterium]
MAIEGPLRELGMHDVFQLLELSRKTGVLSITSEVRDNRGTVYFDRGIVIFAEIDSNPHQLGELLISAGKIGEEDLSQARGLQQRGDKRKLGEILVGIGAIVREELERQIIGQVEAIIFELLGWREGHFSFEDGDVPELRGRTVVRIPIEALLMEGARRIDEWSRIQRKIPHTGVIPYFQSVTDGEESPLDLLPIEWEVLATVGSESSVAEIARLVNRSDFDVAKMIFGLESAGVLAVREAAPIKTKISPEDIDKLAVEIDVLLAKGEPENALGRARSAIEAMPDEPVLYLLLGRILAKIGRHRDAEENLRRALKMDSMLGRAHRELGAVLAKQGKYAEAVDWWQRWLGVDKFTQAEPREVPRITQAVEAAQNLESLLQGTNV